MPLTLDDFQTRMVRLRHQRLLPTGEALNTPAQVLGNVLAVQAQELPAGRLAIHVRSSGIPCAKIEQARQVERSIVWTWLPRGTLHLLAAADARWLLPLLGPALVAANRRRFEQLGWDEGRYATAAALLLAALSKQEALSRQKIRQILAENALPEAGQATVHLLYRLALEGKLIAGPDREKKPTYALLEGWLGALETLDRTEALASLARRYLEAYAPAAPPDLAKWSGLKMGEARQAFQFLESELRPVQADGKEAWLLESQLPGMQATLGQLAALSPVVKLLPRFDTYLLGYARRDRIVDPAYAPRILTGGIIQPVVLVDGRAVGVWKASRRGRKMQIAAELFERLSPPAQERLEAECAAVEAWLEGEGGTGDVF